MEKETVLVTGGAGYVGSVLCSMLVKSDLFNVVCVDTLVKGDGDSLLGIINEPNFKFYQMDAGSPKIKSLVDEAQYVVHLAGLVGAPKCAKSPGLSKILNVESTANVVSLLTGQKIVYASTGSVYGKIEGVCTEDTPLNPLSEYGVDKKLAEDIVSAYKNSVSFRFATGCGVSPCMRVNLLVNNLVYDAVHNRSITLFEADARRTFISVYDMARAFIFGMKNNLKHKVYNCGDDSLNISKRGIAEKIKQQIGCAVFYGDHQKDADARDYEVSYKRLADEGFTCVQDVDKVISDLIPAVKLLNVEGRYA